MDTARTARQSLLVLAALALAWVPAAMLAAPRPPVRLEPVVVTADAPAPGDAAAAERQDA